MTLEVSLVQLRKY